MSAAGRWLIDGNNVMGSRPDGWWRDRTGAKTRLAADIAAWSRAEGRPVLLVFDGRADARISAAADDVITVRFAGGGRPDAADDLLVAEARAGDTVVTADRGLLARLPAGVGAVGPTDLLDRLRGSTGGRALVLVPAPPGG